MKMKHLFPTVALSGLFSTAALLADERTGTLDVYWPDVEGGAATLIVTPAGESVLIDTGMPGERDPGRIHRLATEVAGINQVDHLITTHFHIDHFGGAAEVSQKMPVINVWDNGVPDQNPDNNPNDTRFPIMIKPYKEMTVTERHVIRPDDVLPLKSMDGGEFSIRCVAAKEQFTRRVIHEKNPLDCSGVPEKPADKSDNRNSVAMMISIGDFRLFVGGDMTWNTEAALVCPVDRVGRVDVYQVNHHGLDASNNPLLVKTLSPTVSVMSNGVSKGCGPETFQTLQGIESLQAMYQIHKNLRQDGEHNTGDEFIANLTKDCDGHYIKMTVAPDGKSYTVAIPSNGHERTFQTTSK